MHNLEAEAQQILSDFQRRKGGKRVEQQKEQTPEASKADTMETFEKELSELYGLPVKINTKSQATMYFALESPKPIDKGGRGVKRKPLPSYISHKWLQQCRYILKHSDGLAIDVLAGSKSIRAALDEIRHGNRKWTVAIHEAGHTVVALVLGLRPGDVTIINSDGKLAGLTKCATALRGNRVRPEKYTIHARAMVSMAGAEAERVLLNQGYNNGDRTDRANIDALISEDRLKARLRRMTCQLVRRHYLAIEHVAETLVVANTLSGEHINEWWEAVIKRRSKQKELEPSP
jgi:hypothetical protein